jgi:hypothetical protein
MRFGPSCRRGSLWLGHSHGSLWHIWAAETLGVSLTALPKRHRTAGSLHPEPYVQNWLAKFCQKCIKLYSKDTG